MSGATEGEYHLVRARELVHDAPHICHTRVQLTSTAIIGLRIRKSSTNLTRIEYLESSDDLRENGHTQLRFDSAIFKSASGHGLLYLLELILLGSVAGNLGVSI